MGKIFNIALVFTFAMACSGCKEYKEITAERSDGDIVFLLPELPKLGTLYVEQLNPDRDAFESAWSISFASSTGDPGAVQRIVYGRAPAKTKVDAMSEPKPLLAGVLYTVSMDVGPIVAKGIFVIEGHGAERTVRNLTYQEANSFRSASRPKGT